MPIVYTISNAKHTLDSHLLTKLSYSEMHLADALLVWLDANKRLFDLSASSKDNIVNLMEQVMFRSVSYAEIN